MLAKNTMMILNKDEVLEKKEEIVSAIKMGNIFIYPTDTIYGIGCDATNKNAVAKIRQIKRRDNNPMSVAVPSKNWIKENCEVIDSSKLDLLPGPYTLILKIKNPNAIASNVSFKDTLGVRIPNNWFAEIITQAGVPFVTTSVNFSGEKNMEKIEDVPKELLDQVDYVIYDGPIVGKQSTRIDLSSASLG